MPLWLFGILRNFQPAWVRLLWANREYISRIVVKCTWCFLFSIKSFSIHQLDFFFALFAQLRNFLLDSFANYQKKSKWCVESDIIENKKHKVRFSVPHKIYSQFAQRSLTHASRLRFSEYAEQSKRHLWYKFHLNW